MNKSKYYNLLSGSRKNSSGNMRQISTDTIVKTRYCYVEMLRIPLSCMNVIRLGGVIRQMW